MGREGSASKPGRDRPSGVEIRRGKRKSVLRVHFSFKGVECRERLNLEPTPKNILYAKRMLGEIQNRIELGTFVYTEYFPRSKRAVKFGFARQTRRLLKEALEDYLKIADKNLEKSTARSYRRVSNAHLFPELGDVALVDLTPARLRTFIVQLPVTMKTIRNILVPLRNVLDTAVTDREIPFNPLDVLKLKKLVAKEQRKSDYVVKPFNAADRAAILKAAGIGHLGNMIATWWWSGLRHEEIIALEWSDIDFARGIIRVHHVNSEGEERDHTKTEAGMREILMLPGARQALKRQEALTRFQGGKVFCNPRTNKPWATVKTLTDNQWPTLLKHAGVSYRGPNQCRHTYASMLLMWGEAELWLAKQMGHKTVEMLRRHYGKLIEERDQTGGYELRHDWSAEVV